MRITKQRLKQLILEEFNILLKEQNWADDMEAIMGRTFSELKEQNWVGEITAIMEEAVNLYNTMPEEGKRHFIEKFEMYARRWKEELGAEENYGGPPEESYQQ